LFSSFAGAIIGGVALTGGRGKISGVFGGILLLGILEWFSLGCCYLDQYLPSKMEGNCSGSINKYRRTDIGERRRKTYLIKITILSYCIKK
jgi:predicted ABC-type sugar transport system permease subunit